MELVSGGGSGSGTSITGSSADHIISRVETSFLVAEATTVALSLSPLLGLDSWPGSTNNCLLIMAPEGGLTIIHDKARGGTVQTLGGRRE